MRCARAHGLSWSQWRAWRFEDRAAALALQEIEDDTCSGCGNPLSETTHPDNRRGYQQSPPIECFSCKAQHLHSAALERTEGGWKAGPWSKWRRPTLKRRAGS